MLFVSCNSFIPKDKSGITVAYDNNLNKFNSVKSAIKNNEIQKARDIVSTSEDENELYNAIRKNEIQKARNIVDIVEY